MRYHILYEEKPKGKNGPVTGRFRNGFPNYRAARKHIKMRKILQGYQDESIVRVKIRKGDYHETVSQAVQG